MNKSNCHYQNAQRVSGQRLAIITIIAALLLVKSPASFALSPCEENPQVCTLVWSSNKDTFMSSNVTRDDTHGDTVHCDLSQDDTLSNDNKTLALHYSRGLDQIKNTYYTAIRGVINPKIGNDTHGYIEASLVVSNDLPGDLSWQIWPAFWLCGTDGAIWPTAGEIDIAEDMASSTTTNLHGYETLESMPADWYLYDKPIGALTPGLK